VIAVGWCLVRRFAGEYSQPGFCKEFQVHVAAGFGPLVRSINTAPTRRMIAARSGKIPTTSVRRLISLFSRSWVVGPDLPPDLAREAGEGQQITSCLIQVGGGVGEALRRTHRLFGSCQVKPRCTAHALFVDIGMWRCFGLVWRLAR
jgi:hypothetical protein